MRPTEIESDATLLQRVVEGSTAAFDVVYQRHAEAVTRYAWGLTPSRESAQETLQDTFVTFWRNAHRVRLVGDSLLPWLLVTCRNQASNARRAESRTARTLRTMKFKQSRITADHDAGDEGLRWILHAIDNLPDRDRAVVLLCLVDGHTYAQAAKVLDVSEAAVGKRLQRSRIALRKELAHDE